MIEFSRVSSMARPTVARGAALLAALVTLTVAAPRASACGGLFPPAELLSQVPESPVDQNAARIAFVVDRASGHLCTHLQVQYRGAPETFAWIVPVPTVPEIAESDDALFRALDEVTALTVVPPPFDFSACDDGNSGSSGCGCGPGGTAKGRAGGPGPPDTEPRSPVIVYDTVTTENYAGVVVGGEQADALIDWLRENGFHFADSQRPVVEAYVREGMKFAAFKLRAGKTARDTAPVVLCYEAAAPAVPLRLASLAAQPRMGVSVFVLSDVTFDVAGGHAIAPDPEGIVYDPLSGRTNYFEWVARTADESDGDTWVLDFAGAHGLNMPLPGQGESGHEPLASDFPWLTHFYTRLNAEHMVEDPVFAPGPGQTTRAAVLDLSTQPGIPACGEVLAPSVCFDTYCGLGAECVALPNAGRAYCVCPAGAVAVAVTGPDAVVRVTCAPGGPPHAAAVDPCADYDCGAGACVSKGGFPACVCDSAAGAFADPDGRVACAELPAKVDRFGPGGGPESVRTDFASATAALGADSGPLPFLAVLLGARGLIRRRRGRIGGVSAARRR